MVIAESTLSKNWITNRIKVTSLFLFTGLLSGLVSGWVSSTPRLRSFLYIKGDKFLIPTHKFWIVFALVFSAALVAAYFLSRAFGWLTLSPSVVRQLLALIITTTSPVLLHVMPRADFLIGADVLIAPIYYVALLPLAMCVVTAHLRLLALAILQNVLVFIAAIIVLYLVFSLINGAQAVYEYVQTGIVESFFAAAFGSWLTWTPTRFYQRTA
jgi:hypothetical protein